MDLPFDGAISAFYRDEAPDEVRRLIDLEDDADVPNPRFPYPEQMKRRLYEAEMDALQVELVRMQSWAKASGERVCILFEGRDAAGKGGAIKAVTENLNPRGARVVALPKPTEAEAGQWYFQRYVAELPTRGEIAIFDRSWYNRGVVDHVFGFCTPEERETFFRQVIPFEEMLAGSGIRLFKIWLDVGRATQLERFLDRERDPLRQWKLSWVDVEGLRRWEAYSEAIVQTLRRTDHPAAPWTVIRGDDKRRARLAVIRSVLSPLPYEPKDAAALGTTDPRIVEGVAAVEARA